MGLCGENIFSYVARYVWVKETSNWSCASYCWKDVCTKKVLCDTGHISMLILEWSVNVKLLLFILCVCVCVCERETDTDCVMKI